MSDLPPPFMLTDGEKISPLWNKLKAHLEDRLREARGKNDGPMPPDETSALRGKISCLKSLIALGNELPPIDG